MGIDGDGAAVIRQGMRRRFYATVGTAAIDGGFTVVLDGKAVRTPAGRMLVVPSSALAEALAGEWQSQEKTLRPETMPLTRLVVTAIDRVAGQRDAVIDAVMTYADADTLCYRAETPADLVALQCRRWQPLLDWAEARWQVRFAVATGVAPLSQPAATTAALRSSVAAMDDLRLTTLAAAVQVTGSLVIGLALIDGYVTGDTAFALALLDEEYQAGKWGRDPEAERRRRDVRDEIRCCETMRRFLPEA